MWNNKKQQKIVFPFKLDFQNVDQHTGGHVVNPRHQRRQSVAKPGIPLQIISAGNVNMTYRSPKETYSIQYSRRMSRGRNIQRVVHLQKQNYLCKGSLKLRSKGT